MEKSRKPNWAVFEEFSSVAQQQNSRLYGTVSTAQQNKQWWARIYSVTVYCLEKCIV